MRRTTTILCLGLATWLAGSPEGAAQDYDLIVLDPTGGSPLELTGCSDVNDLGRVVGLTVVNGVREAFEWTSDEGITYPVDVPDGGNRRLNDNGDWIAPGFNGIAELVLADGTRITMPDPLNTGVPAAGRDLNDARWVIGQGVSTGTSSGLFAWNPVDGTQAVQIPSGREFRRLNAHGQAVGNVILNGTDTRAFLVDLPSGDFVDLHAMLPGSGGSEAFDVNDHGQVVGFGPDATSLSAWVWTPGQGFEFLPPLLGGSTLYVRPRAIDNAGRVVGSALTGAGQNRAFLWDPATGMTDLNTVVDTGDMLLVEAHDLSESGVIIGRGFHSQVWAPDRGFILDPVEPPPATAPRATHGAATLRTVSR